MVNASEIIEQANLGFEAYFVHQSLIYRAEDGGVNEDGSVWLNGYHEGGHRVTLTFPEDVEMEIW